ncbi:hypothetical protein HDU79_005499 [Rhizoclosmatium sp. JEL0117]|nr:hypothetical protein HDU79_005499 [Rhizoclosmatium sp. JEL0117]
MNILPKAETSKKEQRFEYKISSQNGQEVLLTTHDVKASAGVRGVFTKDDKRYEWKDGSEGDGFYMLKVDTITVATARAERSKYFTGTSPSSAPCASVEYFGQEGDELEQFALITLWSILMGDMFNKQGRLKDVFTKRVHKFDLGEVWVPGTGVAFDSNDLARDAKQVQNAFGKMGRGFGKLFGK